MWANTEERVMNVELGADKSRLSVHRAIQAAVADDDFVLIGGPPCQAYSIIGRSRRLGVGSSPTDSNTSRNRKNLETEFYRDPKHRLYREYLEIIALHRPIAFVMENVKGLSSARVDREDTKGRMFQQIKQDLEGPSAALRTSIPVELTKAFGKLRDVRYRLFALGQDDQLFENGPTQASDFILRSEDYGVPQARHRIILLGLREDVVGRPKPLRLGTLLSAREAIASLPVLRSRPSDTDLPWLEAIESELTRIPPAIQIELGIPDCLRRMAADRRKLTTGASWLPVEIRPSNAPALSWLSDSQLGGVLQHEARSHMASDLVRYLFCAAFAQRHNKSPSIEDWPPSLRPEHRNVKTLKGKLQTTGFSDRFKVQGIAGPDGLGRPSSTVTSHISKDGHYYIHFDPTQCRSLTVREAARLQTFPDNYFFSGNRTQQYHQVGNAVPPYLATQIASAIAKLLAS